MGNWVPLTSSAVNRRVVDWVLVFLFILSIFAVAVPVLVIYQEITFPSYAKEHGCKPASVARDEKGMTCVDVGEHVTCNEHTSTKELWVCADGERIWR